MMRMGRRVLCLDWDRRSLRVVVARMKGGVMSLQDAHLYVIPPGTDPDDPSAMGEFIKNTLKIRGLASKNVVLDIPRDKVTINRLVFPPTPFEELAAAVRFRAMQELPFPLDSASVDFVIMQRDATGKATEVLMVAVQLDTLERLKQTCAAAGLTPERIGLRPYANLTSVRRLHGAADGRILFVDVGPSASEIDVMSGEALAFTRSANVTVPPRTTELQRHQDSRVLTIVPADDEEAEDQEQRNVVNELMVEVTRTLQAYRAMEPDAAIDRIVVAGRTGAEAGLVEALEQRFGLPCELYDPTQALRVGPEQADKLRQFAAPLGQAWNAGQTQNNGDTLDFLNPKKPIPPRQSFNRRVRVISIATAAVLVIAASVAYQRYAKLAGELSVLRQDNIEKAKQLKENYAILEKVENVRDDWAKEAIWPDLLRILTEEAIEPGKKMMVREIALDRRMGTITLFGLMAANWQVPTDYTRQLNEITVDGRKIFEARQGEWGEFSQPELGKFNGKVDVTINLLDLKRHQSEQKQREQSRKERLRGL